MAAIQPARLKKEAGELGLVFDQPDEFVRSLEDLLDRYADRTRRPGQSGKPPPLIPAYHVAAPVMRQIILVLNQPARTDPDMALELADQLWERVHLECLDIATRLVGLAADKRSEGALQRVLAWADPRMELDLMSILFRQAAAPLWKLQAEPYFEQIMEWLESRDEKTHVLGLQALVPIIEDPEFDNLPRVFRLISPISTRISARNRVHMLDVLRALSKRSPGETAYFLRQNLISANDRDAAWYVRQLYSNFPDKTRELLRKQIRELK